MHLETKQESMTLPPGLPELPPVPEGFDRWEYRGKSWKAENVMYGVGDEFAPSWDLSPRPMRAKGYVNYHYIEAVKSEAIPATLPVVETTLFYEDGFTIVPFADIQHIEKLKRGPYPPQTTEPAPNGLHVITSKTRYDMAADMWSNPVYISQENSERFLSEYKDALIAAARKQP